MNTKRSGKTANPPHDHLANVPTPLHAGEGIAWMPAKVILEQAEAAGVARNDDALALARESNRRWDEYRAALAKADLERFGDPALATPASRKRRAMDKAHYYNRARLGAWTAAIGPAGLERWALIIAETRLAKALAKRTRHSLSTDLLPDLPRRCDLTDAAIEAAKALQAGEHWRTLAPAIDDACDCVLDEALPEMGWTD